MGIDLWFYIEDFQFTHPGRGATYVYGYAYSYFKVSIHAPREGCDSLVISDKNLQMQFQFTHPGRGATQQSAL